MKFTASSTCDSNYVEPCQMDTGDVGIVYKGTPKFIGCHVIKMPKTIWCFEHGHYLYHTGYEIKLLKVGDSFTLGRSE